MSISNNTSLDPACGVVLYRALSRGKWIDPDDTTRVKVEAFFRRPPETVDGTVAPRDVNGLSLFRTDRVSEYECADEFKKCYGMVTLHVGTLRDLGLIIEPDEVDNRKVLIKNLPFENPGNAAEETLVGDVADTARVLALYKPPRKRP